MSILVCRHIYFAAASFVLKVGRGWCLGLGEVQVPAGERGQWAAASTAATTSSLAPSSWELAGTRRTTPQSWCWLDLLVTKHAEALKQKHWQRPQVRVIKFTGDCWSGATCPDYWGRSVMAPSGKTARGGFIESLQTKQNLTLPTNGDRARSHSRAKARLRAPAKLQN